MSNEAGKQTFEDALLAFDKQRPSYVEYADRLSALLCELLPQESIAFQSIERRAKSLESLREKFGRPGKSYNNGLADITNLCGLRVITYSLDDVNRVCDLIHREFKPLPEHTIDKAAILAPAEFGYRSRHFVVELGPNRVNLTEWRRFAGFLTEIQVRTVLEHAWAAMDHSLRYKREADVPGEQKRALFRLSALLELADESFDALKKQQREIRADAQSKLATPGDKTLELNSLTYSAYEETSAVLEGLTNLAYAAGFDRPESGRNETDSTVSELIAFARAQGIGTIHDLDRALQEEKITALPYFRDLMGASETEWQIGATFAAVLCLVRRDSSITTQQLVENGFHSGIAHLVVSVADRHRSAS